MASPSPHPVVQLLAQMQAVENLRAQNAAAAQNLAVQLQSLAAAQAQTRDLAAQRRAQDLALATAQLSVPAPMAPTASTSSSAAPPARPAPVAASPPPAEAAPEEDDEEVPRCHLHRKMNKACKFCKAHAQSLELKKERAEERKNAQMERLREGAASGAGSLHHSDKAPLPNLMHFPQVMQERINKNDNYNMTISAGGIAEVKNVLFSSETCDTESRAHNSLDLEPSSFICCVYRLLLLQLTEGQLHGLMNSRSCWIRCAGFLYVRLGIHQDRYWELLSDALMDDEEFVPFPARGGETMSVGQYVEQLLAKDKYCNLNLPRIPVAQRRSINKRLVLYGQFRRRYAANLEVLERFKDPGVQVEVCNPDGEWQPGETVGTQSSGRRCTTVRVRLPGGQEQDTSLGMLIVPPGRGGERASGQDLTRTRGRSAQELLERFNEQQRDSAVASGKDYCKTSGQHTMRVGGVPFVAGVKRKELEKEEESDGEQARGRSGGPSIEHRAKMAAIESKYCARVAPAQSRGGEHGDSGDGLERLRLG